MALSPPLSEPYATEKNESASSCKLRVGLQGNFPPKAHHPPGWINSAEPILPYQIVVPVFNKD